MTPCASAAISPGWHATGHMVCRERPSDDIRKILSAIKSATAKLNELFPCRAICRFSVCVAALLAASSTCTATVSFPKVLGVPLRTPVEGLSERPAWLAVVPGANDQLNGPTPPAIAREVEYAAPCVAFGSVVVVMDNAGLTTSVKDRVICALELSTTWMVNVDEPVEGAEPEITPLAELSVRPTGSCPAETVKVYGTRPPLTEMLCE